MDEALPVLTSALQLRPEYLAAKLKLGEALLAAGKTKEAGEFYEGILKDHPDAECPTRARLSENPKREADSGETNRANYS
jgi:thioredoxin-like negative regulator of GroEL